VAVQDLIISQIHLVW